MPRRNPLMLVATVAVLIAPMAAQQPPGRGTRGASAEAIGPGLQSALDAYAGGDDLAAARWVRSLDDPAALRNVGAFMARQPWSRSAAAFVLEVLIATPDIDRLSMLLIDGRALLARRPLGTNPEDDRFEVLWHQTVIGLLQGLPMVELQHTYLDAIGPRFADAAARGVTLDNRFSLARGFAAAIICCWERRANETVRQIPRELRGSMTRDDAIAMFDRASDEPAVRVEALVRGGKLLYEAGRLADALVRFARVPVHDDPVIGYVQHLTHGRVLDALDRPADAVAAYRAALVAASPSGQHAGIGLAAALLRSGQTDEAIRAAEEARLMSARQGHLPAFNRGDQRFMSRWLLEIRNLRR